MIHGLTLELGAKNKVDSIQCESLVNVLLSAEITIIIQIDFIALARNDLSEPIHSIILNEQTKSSLKNDNFQQQQIATNYIE